MAFKDIFSYLGERNKLSLRNVRSGQEIWHVFVSRIGITVSFLALLLVVSSATLALVVYTPLTDWIPGYPGTKSREALLQNIMKLDSLRSEVDSWGAYHANFARILDGQLPVSEGDTVRRQGVRGTPSQPVKEDSILRREMTAEGSIYRLQDGQGGRARAEVTFEMMPPVKGMLTRRFNPAAGFPGVELAPAPGQAVVAVLDGTVVLNSWDPQRGNIVAVQHGGNLVSIYKQVARTIKKVGEPVRAGEPVAITRQLTDNGIPHLIFELWYNGLAVDPQNYIVF